MLATQKILNLLGWADLGLDSTEKGLSIAPSIYGYESTACPCAICAEAVAGASMVPGNQNDPNFRGIDFFFPPSTGQGPSTPDNRPGNRFDSGRGPVPLPQDRGQRQSPNNINTDFGQPQAAGINDIANSEVFNLSSNISASKTIYLDFNGYNTSGTAWNAQGSNSISSIPAFSLDSTVSTTYSQAELDAIKEIFLRVAADYAPFNVNVTTAAPVADRITRSSSSDSVYGTVAAIGNVGSTIYSGAGGIAYVGIYDLTESSTASQSGSYYKPALVFPGRLGSNKNIAEATSHEVGHNLNLRHDGTSTSSYYSGGGSSPGWAPIMGVGYGEPLVQFSRGQYSSANNFENDFTNITSEGVGRYPDSANTSLTNASTITLNSTGYGGVYDMINLMSSNGDSAVDGDFFKFVAPSSGAATISINNALMYSKNGGVSYIGSDLPSGYGNVHLDAQILDSIGNVVSDWNNNTQLDVSSLSASVVAGQTYYVKVMPNATIPDLSIGETTWGSLGSYALRINATTSTDTTAPLVSSFSPVDGAAGVAVGSNIILTFNESIARGTGTITLRSGSASGSILESFDAATSARLSVSGSTITVDPTSNLAAGTNYYLVFPTGSVRDLAGNNYLGTSTYDFFTASSVDDYTATTSTTGVVNVGSSVTGNLERVGDHDWFRVNLTDGTAYTFRQNATTLADPLLSLRNSSGAFISSNDDSGDTNNSLIQHTATYTGAHFLDAGAYLDNITGTYVVSAAVVDDYAANTSTTGVVNVGSSASGNIQFTGDHDWFRVSLTAGRTYTFRQNGTGLGDPELTLRNSSGASITSNDDSGGTRNSLIQYKATYTGAYFLDAGGFGNNATGTYTVSAI